MNPISRRSFVSSIVVALAPNPEAIAIDGSGRTVVLEAAGVLRRFTTCRARGRQGRWR
jgi:hypothetical protein